MLKLTYIYHDGFIVETAQATVLFDWWLDESPFESEKSGGNPGFLNTLDRDKPLYIVVSHHHKDHFNKEIFDLKDAVRDVRFIISRDTERSIRYMLKEKSTYRGDRPRPEQVTVLAPGETYQDEVIKVIAYGSTDIGNSYSVTLGGYRLFHAGDLNAWIWKDESTPVEVETTLRDYEKILDSILRRGEERFDIAMFPVDSRIGTDYWEGAKIFVRKFYVSVFVPMHFGLGEDKDDARRKMADACRFEEYANPTRGLYVALQTPYSSLSLPDKRE